MHCTFTFKPWVSKLEIDTTLIWILHWIWILKYCTMITFIGTHVDKFGDKSPYVFKLRSWASSNMITEYCFKSGFERPSRRRTPSVRYLWIKRTVSVHKLTMQLCNYFWFGTKSKFKKKIFMFKIIPCCNKKTRNNELLVGSPFFSFFQNTFVFWH
jgi:hypothetical protein